MAGPSREIEALIELMAKLPGLGPRSARRAVLHLLKRRGLLMAPLAEALRKVAAEARDCTLCGTIGTAAVCDVCRDPARATGEICVVAEVPDLWAMERAGVFRGRYHVLGGLLSALDGIGPEDLRLPALLARLPAEAVREVILALPATVEGQTTAHYLALDLAAAGVTVTQLARGMPMGGELDWLDDGTIGASFRARRGL